MKYLLDTHVFLWTISNSGLLPANVGKRIRDPENEVYISSVNLWEIAIKARTKKLDLGSVSISDLIPLSEEMGFQLIGLSPEEAITYGNLKEDSHFDPFDRMLIWQAIIRKLILVSKDSEFGKFVPDGLRVLWN